MGIDLVSPRWIRRQAIKKFVALFLQELRDRGVENKEIKHKKYKTYLGKLVSDPDVRELLLKSFESGFVYDRTQIEQIEQIWTQKYQPSEVPFPAAFGWDFIVDRIQQIWTQKYQPSGVPFPADFNWDLLIEKYQAAVTELRKRNEKEQKLIDIEVKEGNTKAIEANTKVQKSIAPIPVGFDINGYPQSLKDSYGSLKLNTLDRTDKEYQIRLWQMFIKQNVREALPPSRFEIPQHYKQALFASGQLDRDLNSEQVEQYRRQYLEKSPELVLTAIESPNCQRAVVLGDPGSGKSTLLQYLALDWAEGKTERFPLLIELREYVNDRSASDSFLEFLERGTRADRRFDRHQLDEYLRTKPSLVMFDGLDEVFDRQDYQCVLDQIANFATQQYPNAKIIVTSRIIGYNPERLRDANFQHFTLQELDRSQIEKFIDRWYQLALGEDPEKERLKQRLKDAIDNSAAIANLADNPMLLTMMAILNRRESLPRDRAELYDQSSRVLLHHWDVEGKNLEISLEIGLREKQAMLRAIAYEMQSGEKGLAGNLIDGGRLQDILTAYLKPKIGDRAWVKAGQLIGQLRSRNYILCDRGADTYGFVHRTFLEYFCATEIVRRFEKERSLSLEKLQDDIFGEHWQDKTWHEVLRLICGLLEPIWAGQLVEFLMGQKVDRSDYLDDKKRANKEAFQHLQLAIECFAEVRDPESLSSIAAELKEKLTNEVENQSGILISDGAGNSLIDSIGKYYTDEPDTLTWLQNFALQYKHRFVRAAVESIGKYYHTKPETLTWLKNFAALDDQDEWVRLAAVESIGKHYPTKPETLTWLKNFAAFQNFAALHTLDWIVRLAAVESIGKYYHTEPETLTWLKNFAALRYQDHSVRQAAVESIGKYYHTEPETLTWLKDFAALHDQDRFVRAEAVESIGQYYHTEPETLSWLQNPAFQAQDGWVRRAAVTSIAKYYHTKPETLSWLQNPAFQDQHEWVRRAAVTSISEYYHTEPETLGWLQNFAFHDQHESVRRATVESISKYYRTEPETLSWLQNFAFQDQHKSVRQAVVESITKYYHTEPETLGWFQNFAFHDQHESVRRAAVTSITKYYHTKPETLGWFQNFAFHDQHESVRRAAVTSIAKYYHTEPETLGWLQNFAFHDQHESVREEAVESIAKYYHTEPETLGWFQNFAFHDQHESVREEAVESIGQYYHTEPETLSWFQNFAFHDQHEEVRRAAVRSIAEYYHTEPETLSWLQNFATLDQDRLVRRAAVESIGKYYHTEPRTLSWLQNFATLDQDRLVRRAAVESIGQYYIQADGIFELLCQIASQDISQDDSYFNPRQTALEALVKHYIDRPEVIELLRDRSTQDPDEQLRKWAEERLKNIV
jgi:HEAT repeat protein